MACVPHSANATSRTCGNANRSPLPSPTPEEPVVHGAVSDIERGPVDRHHPPPGQERPRRHSSRQRPRHPLEQRPQRLEPQPLPSLKIADFDGNLTGSTPGSAHASPSVINPNTSS